MTKKIFLIIAIIIAISPLSVYAQNKLVSGIVKSDGEPMVGVNIMIKGTTVGTVTDIDGKYSINVPENKSILQYSFIGYITEERNVENNKIINVTLNEDLKTLDEVVILGYGANSRKQDLSASVGVVDDFDKLASRPVGSTQGMLQGQLAGVTVSSNGGDPSSVPSVVIRGQGSKNGDNVLWVVDGVPGAPIASASDIESIVVLKDAASAAIYGAQSGAGGVVLVTTKKSKVEEPSLSYNGTFGFRQATNLPQSLNAQEQIEMRKISYKNAGLSLPKGWDVNANPWIGTTRTDWMDEIFRTALFQRHDVALNVGTKSFKNRISFSYSNDEGTLIDTFKKSFVLRYNATYNLNKWVDINENLVWTNSSNRSIDTNSGYTGAVMAALYMPRSATVYNPLDGTYGGVTTEDPEYIKKYGSNFADIHGDAVNPVRLLSSDNNYNRSTDMWSTTSLSIKNIVPGLKFQSRFSYNLSTNLTKNFHPLRDEVGKPDLSNKLSESTYRVSSWNTENSLTYDNSFGDHTLGLLVSTTADHTENRGFSVNGIDFSDESKALQYIAYAKTVSANDYLKGPDANVSCISRLAYSYSDKYFFTYSYRRDYAGRLPKENNYGDFHAVTAAWKISNEKFFPKNEIINLLKLRASWGRVGNLGSISYNYKSALLEGLTNKYNSNGQYGVTTGDNWKNLIYDSNAINPNLTWETSEQIDLGLDMDLFDSRLSIVLDYFDKKTFNLIQNQTMNWPITIGKNAMKVNQGEIRNRGFEAQIGWSDKVNKNVSYYMSGNFSYLKNWVSDIGVKNSDGTSGVWTGGGNFRNLPYVYQTAQGEPLNSFYLIKTDGLFQSDEEAQNYVKDGKRIQPNAKAGDMKFVDYNNDGIINDKDRQYCGAATPKTTFALNFGITYKNLSLSGLLQGVGGAQALNIAKNMTLADNEGNFNRSKDILKAWSPNNTSSNIPRLSKSDSNGNFTTVSDWYLENASYLRLKNITLAYDLTPLLRTRSFLNGRKSNFSIFASGENLLTITDYTGMDPECGGYDAMKYPVSRVMSLGVKITY